MRDHPSHVTVRAGVGLLGGLGDAVERVVAVIIRGHHPRSNGTCSVQRDRDEVILSVEVAVVVLRRRSRPCVLDEIAAEEHPQRAEVPRSSGPLRRVRAVVDRPAVCA
jgi:hypothetical protein